MEYKNNNYEDEKTKLYLWYAVMADYRALMSVSEAIINLLRANYNPDDFNNQLEFKVFTSKDFKSNSISSGVSLFPLPDLYQWCI